MHQYSPYRDTRSRFHYISEFDSHRAIRILVDAMNRKVSVVDETKTAINWAIESGGAYNYRQVY